MKAIRRAGLLMVLAGFNMMTGCTPAPTAQVLPTTMATPAPVVSSPKPSATPAATRTPEPTATNTLAPTATDEPLTISELLERDYIEVAGIAQIDSVDARPMEDGWMVYSEIQVASGTDFEATADELMRLTNARLIMAVGSGNIAPLEFGVIIANGARCADYIFDLRDDEWRVTELTCPKN